MIGSWRHTARNGGWLSPIGRATLHRIAADILGISTDEFTISQAVPSEKYDAINLWLDHHGMRVHCKIGAHDYVDHLNIHLAQ